MKDAPTLLTEQLTVNCQREIPSPFRRGMSLFKYYVCLKLAGYSSGCAVALKMVFQLE
ncbi:hypothetical protein [Komarekiella delphini-convector]|uniref:hypothetical protein n=1 Tax=Komarekiella delphini-convector TaxID=3050158 RepID=UPI00177BDD53|nr:hypothetical protein [Komarekiella delphini-convector]